MKRVWKLRDNLYHFDVYLFAGSARQLKQWMRSHGLPADDVPDHWGGMCQAFTGAGNTLVIWSERMTTDWRDSGTLVHECVHAANKVLDLVGVTDRNEALAYLVQFYYCGLCDAGFNDWRNQ